MRACFGEVGVDTGCLPFTSAVASTLSGSSPISVRSSRLRVNLAFSLLLTLLREPLLVEIELEELVEVELWEFIRCNIPGSVCLSMTAWGVPWYKYA